jgi:hypothetical protein
MGPLFCLKLSGLDPTLLKPRAIGHRPTGNGRSRMEVTFDAIFFAALQDLLSPKIATMTTVAARTSRLQLRQ